MDWNGDWTEGNQATNPYQEMHQSSKWAGRETEISLLSWWRLWMLSCWQQHWTGDTSTAQKNVYKLNFKYNTIIFWSKIPGWHVAIILTCRPYVAYWAYSLLHDTWVAFPSMNKDLHSSLDLVPHPQSCSIHLSVLEWEDDAHQDESTQRKILLTHQEAQPRQCII